MVAFVAKKPMNKKLVIYDHHGEVWLKSKIGFLDNFSFQNNHPRAKKNYIEAPQIQSHYLIARKFHFFYETNHLLFSDIKFSPFE